MRNVLQTSRLLDRADAAVSFSLAGSPATEERRYVEAVAAEVGRIGRAGDWQTLAAMVVRMVASGTLLCHDTRAQARILDRALSTR